MKNVVRRYVGSLMKYCQLTNCIQKIIVNIKIVFFAHAVCFTLLAFSNAFAQDVMHSTYLPLIQNGARVASLLLNEQESVLEEMLLGDPQQQHPHLRFSPLLSEQARKKANDMAQRHYLAHITPDGFGPNYLVRQAGYHLPVEYDYAQTGNNIESIAAGYATVETVWEAWMESDSHRVHLLGEYEFFRAQTEYGIGYAFNPSAPYRYYWVILIAKPGQ